MYLYRRLKVTKDVKTDTYVYHLDDDVEFHSADRDGMLYNQMVTTLIDQKNLIVEVWMDEPRAAIWQSYIQGPMYAAYLAANAHTRYDVEEPYYRNDIPALPTEYWFGMRTTTPLIDAAVHEVANSMFTLQKKLMPVRQNLVFVTAVSENPTTWYHFVVLTPEQKVVMDEVKDVFLAEVYRKMSEFAIPYDVL